MAIPAAQASDGVARTTPSVSEPAPFGSLSCRDLTVTIADRNLVAALSLTAPPGTVTAVLGCNGAGKTLTLHTLAGLRTAGGGEVRLDEREIGRWPRRALARRLGLLTQMTEDPFPSTVIETVLVGRHPHLNFWQWEGEADRSIARASLAAVDLEGFDAREIVTLSGGERRRVAIAALLTQNPQALILDEPTNQLDPHHQLDVLRLLRSRANDGATVLMSLHDPGLASRFADQALLLFGDGAWLFGAVGEILNEANLSRLYQAPVRELRWEGGRTFLTI